MRSRSQYRTAAAFYGNRPNRRMWSASVLKAMLLVAYFRPTDGSPGETLNTHDRSLLHPMITRSSNDPANALDELIGARGLHALAVRVGMTHFAAAAPIWGES